MPAGKYRESVDAEGRPDDLDSTGHDKENWSVLIANQAVSIEPINGKEYESALGENALVDTRIRARYSSAMAALTADNRFVDTRTGEIYDIVTPMNPHTSNKELVFMCERRVRF